LPADAPAGSFMSENPVAIAQTDSAVVAASAFRENGLKYLPVIADQQSRRMVGFIRARKLMASVMQRVGAPSA
jgi:predicted transcriptional regulator